MVAILLWVNDQLSQCVGHCFERDKIFLVSTPFGRPFDLTNLKVVIWSFMNMMPRAWAGSPKWREGSALAMFKRR
jgi:hypothetical protein